MSARVQFVHSRRLTPGLLLSLVRSPGCLLGPAQFFQRSPAAALHRSMLRRSWPERPRWQWFLLLGAGWTRWWLLGAWQQLYRVLRYVDPKVEDTGKSRRERVCALFYLALYLGVQPRDYYRLRLYRYERARWLNFVFSQEELAWHGAHSPPGRGAMLLRDKQEMENRARAQGLGAVRTLASFRAGATPEPEHVLQERQSVFLKPNTAYAMRGCMTLERCSENEYRLHGFSLERKPVAAAGCAEVTAALHEAFAEKDYLAQEELRNSAEFARFCGTPGLSTVRLITARVGARPEFVTASLEAPLNDEEMKKLREEQRKKKEEKEKENRKKKKNRRESKDKEKEEEEEDSRRLYHINPIDAAGRLRERASGYPADRPVPRYCGSGEQTPRWEELLRLARAAHELAPDVKTAAWDMTVTDDGAVLLEGNSGWGIAAPQQLTGIPMLETPAATAWAERPDS